MRQTPVPSTHILFFRGDLVTFTLQLEDDKKGKAFLRTNIGNAEVERREFIAFMETRRSLRGQAWHDVRMPKTEDNTFSVTLALLEEGHFEAKCFFYPEGEKDPVWPEGENVHINVEPAEYSCANSIYCAFVRQFGAYKCQKNTDHTDYYLGNFKQLDDKGYTVIPSSGTFRDLIKELDHIIDGLNCRIIHLLPINPTPTVYGKMGRYGSPYASLDFTAIDPALAEFDRKVTPLEQFCELVDAIHLRNAKLFIDIAINHTGWASKIHEEHPDWLIREKDGTIHSPGAWGVTWEDLTELNHNLLDLWRYLADVFLIWCKRGVDGFRCDAGYMIPAEAWHYIIAHVRHEFPNTIFLLEGLGGDPAVTRELLNKTNMNWAYSELFQNFTKDQITGYIPYSQKISMSDGLMVHYAETHDNERLAAKSPVYARMRTTLCAMLSTRGAFGFTNGVEWFAVEKINVHEASSLNWGAKDNQVSHIARLNTILISHPAFYDNAEIKFVDSWGTDSEIDPDTLVFTRNDSASQKKVLILCNLNCEEETKVLWNPDDVQSAGEIYVDLISEKTVSPSISEKDTASFMLSPGEILCLSEQPDDLQVVKEMEDHNVIRPDHIDRQMAKAMALEIIAWKQRSDVMINIDSEELADKILEDPIDFCTSVFGEKALLPVVHWKYPSDLNRTVMIPPGFILFVTADIKFRARILDNDRVVTNKKSLKDASGRYFTLFAPLPVPEINSVRKINLAVYEKDKFNRNESEILFLSKGDNPIPVKFDNSEISDSKYTFLDTNDRGGMCHIPLLWGTVSSRYDALLAANLHPDYPVDRQVMWTGCRGWLWNQAHSQPLCIENTEQFTLNPDGSGEWYFHIPAGNGLYVDISIKIHMIDGENAVRMVMYRHPAKNHKLYLPNETSVRTILRTDIDDRNFHQITKGNKELAHRWDKAVKTDVRSFTFSPVKERQLMISSSKGKFHSSTEWRYSVYYELEATRGLEAHGDIFSPGYFEIPLGGGDKVHILGQVLSPKENEKLQLNIQDNCLLESQLSFDELMTSSMTHYIAKRDKLKTVIAGYPWFLDWGRDTLICARGLITAGFTADVADIILNFAKFVEHGTLPNMIHGDNAENRDTSDAPLWFFSVCRDYIHKMDKTDILEKEVPLKNKKLKEVLIEIAEGYLKGTPNGIRVDPKSSLVYSPAHFTWMDTNYPAGTPRAGYPIEIQALWHSALEFLFEVTDDKTWKDHSENVRKSVTDYFILEEGWLSDCLHSNNFCSPAESEADDALRPNQLFAVTHRLIDDHEIKMDILQATYDLLIPGAIRSLADRPVRYPQPVKDKNGKLLNDPQNPYWRRYEGDEDTRRKPAYHNGTAWTWPFPSYAEAYYMTFGEPGRETAKAILSSSKSLLQKGCFGHLPEILDGDYPHLLRGCDAQAWAITEFYRIWKLLD